MHIMADCLCAQGEWSQTGDPAAKAISGIVAFAKSNKKGGSEALLSPAAKLKLKTPESYIKSARQQINNSTTNTHCDAAQRALEDFRAKVPKATLLCSISFQ